MKRSAPIRHLVVCSLLAAATIAAPTRHADACLNEVLRSYSSLVRDLTLAEKAVAGGRRTAAAEVALRDFPKVYHAPRLAQIPGGTGLDPLGVRAQRVVALALVRTEGLLTVPGHFEPTTADERRANLEWSIAIFRAYASLKKSPAAETDLAEALSKLPETRQEALSILSRLDKGDLVTSPEGYATLAELRQAAGDQRGRDAALERFKRLRPAKRKKIVTDPTKSRS